jgi:hypothetical protein
MPMPMPMPMPRATCGFGPDVAAQLLTTAGDNTPCTPSRSAARLRYDQRTRAYLQRRTTEGLRKQEILRRLKRYIVRDVYTALVADFTALTT